MPRRQDVYGTGFLTRFCRRVIFRACKASQGSCHDRPLASQLGHRTIDRNRTLRSSSFLTRFIHEHFYCNRRDENQNSLRYSFFAPGSYKGRSTSQARRRCSWTREGSEKSWVHSSELRKPRTSNSPRLMAPCARLACRLGSFVTNPCE